MLKSKADLYKDHYVSWFSFSSNSFLAEILDDIYCGRALFVCNKVNVALIIVDLHNSCKFVCADHYTFITVASQRKVCFESLGGLTICVIDASILLVARLTSTQNHYFTFIDGNNYRIIAWCENVC